MKTFLFIVLCIALAGLCWSVYERQKEKNKQKQEANTRYKHRNLN